VSGEPVRCGDCGALNIDGDDVQAHFPDCPTLQERAAGVEVTPSYSNESPRRCPKCGKAMTRNHDQQSDTWTDNCTGAMCGVTVPVELASEPDQHKQPDLPPDPTSPAAAFDAIAAMPGAQVFEQPYPGEGELCPSCQQPIRIDTVERIYQYGEHFFHEPCWYDAKEKL
jgi:ssDNA-binding Zn-finger/Zn-ribbon topoisomerase 1